MLDRGPMDGGPWMGVHGRVAVNDPLPIALFSVQLATEASVVDFISK